MTKILQTLLNRIRGGNRFLLSDRTEKESVDMPEWMQFASACSDLGNGGGAENIQEIRKRAQNDAEAQYALGIAYAVGDGVPRDAEEAKLWLSCAASRGHEEAEDIISALRNDANAPIFEHEGIKDMSEFAAKHEIECGDAPSMMMPVFREHPAGIVYLATQVAPTQDLGKSYFGSTHIKYAKRPPHSRNTNPARRALQRRKAQHYLAAQQSGQLSPFRQALASKETEFEWNIAMVAIPPSDQRRTWRWCMEAAEAWHIHHFGTTVQSGDGYNKDIPHIYRELVELDQSPLFGKNNQYKGCLFCINDSQSKNPGDIAKRNGRTTGRPSPVGDRSWTKSFFPYLDI